MLIAIYKRIIPFSIFSIIAISSVGCNEDVTNGSIDTIPPTAAMPTKPYTIGLISLDTQSNQMVATTPVSSVTADAESGENVKIAVRGLSENQMP